MSNNCDFTLLLAAVCRILARVIHFISSFCIFFSMINFKLFCIILVFVSNTLAVKIRAKCPPDSKQHTPLQVSSKDSIGDHNEKVLYF
jgi:hypothetical protein